MALIGLSIAVHSGAPVASALQRAVRGAEMGADLIEWRVDELASAENALAHVRHLVKDCPLPCIVTCRVPGEGGDYEGPEQQRLDLLLALVGSEKPPRYIDVELASFEKDAHFRGRLRHALEQSSRPARRTSLILSAHDFQGRPRDLMQKLEAMNAEPLCAVMKVAWQARSLRDNLEAFELLGARGKPMIALCMGQFGTMSRVLTGKFGGFLTFASDHATEVTAPGQPTVEELKRLFHFDRIGPATKVYGVIGWPVEHSRSPHIHNAGFDAINFDGVYLPVPIPPEYEHFKATVGAMIDLAGLDFRGASVTIPHKVNLVRFVKERGGRMDALSERIGAANTLIIGSAGGMECVNTDAPAAIEALCAGMGISEAELKDKRVAILGAGGVGRSIGAALIDHGAILSIFNRNQTRAAQLVADLARAFSPPRGGSATSAELESLSRERFDIYINCTPIGMHGGPAPDESPLPPGADARLDEHVTVMDTVYAPPRTPLIAQAEARGARAIPGVEMFSRQAAKQFKIWTGRALVMEPGPWPGVSLK